MSVLDGFEAVGEKTTTNKMTMTVMESSVRFSKGVTEALGCPAYVKLLVNDKQKKIAVQACDAKDENAIKFCKTKRSKADGVDSGAAGKASSVTVRTTDVLVAVQKYFTFPPVADDQIAYFAMNGESYPDEKVVLITTGSQGENMAALSRIAASIHNKVAIKPGDVVIFSSHPIPGNEKAVFKVINELEAKGAHVIFEDTHVSGHACREELKLIYALTRPKYAIPVHGEYRHLKRHAELAVEMGIPKENVKIMTTGDVLEIGEEKFDVVGKVPAQGVFVDGLGVGDVGNIVLRDRQLLSQNGLIIIVVTLDRYSNQLVAGPDIVSRGFVYVRESETLMEDCRITCQEALDRCLSRGVTDWGKIKSVIKDDMGEFLWKRTKRSPMILPIITEV